MSNQDELFEYEGHRYHTITPLHNVHNERRLSDVYLVRDVDVSACKKDRGTCREQNDAFGCKEDLKCIDYLRVVKCLKQVVCEDAAGDAIPEYSYLKSIEHERIPTVYGCFSKKDKKDEKNKIHILQKYISGQNYKQKIETNSQEVDVYSFLKHFLEILIHLQDNKLIHGDIKPSNIMCREQDSLPVLIDFGCVFSTDSTITYSQVGRSINYSPSEVRLGSNEHNYSFDIFSLGRTVVYLLTAKEPTDEVVKNWINCVKPVYRATIKEEFQHIINKAMEEDAKDRYQSAREMLIELSFTNGEGLINNINQWSNIIKKIPEKKKIAERRRVDLQHRFNEQIYKLILDEEKNVNLAQPKEYDKDINKLIREYIIGCKINTNSDESDEIDKGVLQKLAEIKRKVEAQGNNIESSEIVEKISHQFPSLNDDDVRSLCKLLFINFKKSSSDQGEKLKPSKGRLKKQCVLTSPLKLVLLFFMGLIFFPLIPFAPLSMGDLAGKPSIEEIAKFSLDNYKEGKKLESLIGAVQSGIELDKKHPESEISKISEYSTLKPFYALQSNLYNYGENWDIYPQNKLYHGGNDISSFSFSDDEKYLASATFNGSIWIWDLENMTNKPKIIPRQIVAQGNLKSVAFIPGTDYFVTGGNLTNKKSNNTIKIWDTKKLNKFIDETPITKGYLSNIESIKVTPNGKFLITLSTRRDSELVDLKVWKIIRDKDPKKTIQLKETDVTPAGGNYKTVEISPKSSKEFFANFCAEINNQKDEICSNDNPVIVTINNSGNVKLWTIDNNKGKLFEPVHITEDGIGAKFTPDGKSLAIISKNDKTISFKQQKETQLNKIEKSFQVPIEPDIIDFLEKKNSKDFMMLASYRNKGTELIEINDQTPSEAKIDLLKTSLGQVQKQLELVETSLVSINSGLYTFVKTKKGGRDIDFETIKSQWQNFKDKWEITKGQLDSQNEVKSKLPSLNHLEDQIKSFGTTIRLLNTDIISKNKNKIRLLQNNLQIPPANLVSPGTFGSLTQQTLEIRTKSDITEIELGLLQIEKVIGQWQQIQPTKRSYDQIKLTQNYVKKVLFSPKGNYIAIMPEEEKDIELWDLSKPEYIPSHPLKDGLKKILIWKDKNGEPRIIYLSENKEMFQLLLTELVNQTGEVSEKGIPYNKDIDSIFIDDGDILTISHTQENTKTFVGKFDHELKPLEEKIVNKEVASIIRTDDGVYILVDNNNDAYVYKDYSSLSQNSGKMINDNESGIGKISVIRPIPKTPPLLVIGKEEKFCPYDYSKKELVPCDINFDDDEVKKIDLAEFTENGKFLITTDKKKSLNIWNVVNVKSDQGIPIVKFNKKLTLGEKVSLFAIKPGQEPDYLLATLLKIEDTIYIYIWDFQGRQLAQFTTDFDQAENLMFSPDGNILIATGDTKIGDKKIQVWDLKKLKLSKLLSEGCLRLETYLETDKPLKKDCKPHLEKAKKNLSLSLKAY